MPTLSALTRQIEQILADYHRLESACEVARQAGCLDIEGPLHSAIWITFGNMLTHSDPHDWITWFIYENDCGKKALSACGPGQALRPIRTPRQLARLILSMA